MLLSKKSVELLAPAGTWEVLEAAIAAGADAVYLGGKRFNMRMHRTDTNFDDEMLKKAIEYAHAHNVRLYITVNNLISDREIEPMRDYLKFLQTIQPDALLVQDLAVMELVRELKITIPLHTSVMMNTHNEHAINKLKEYGITRIVVGREMTLSQLSLFKERTGIEVEYFMHGDMCISQSGQCFHSGILFGQSSNRGRCLKPCRWGYKLIDEKTGKILDENGPGAYKLALKDMCMYRHLPELIQAGVHSFKIEGRMRTAAFVERIVKTYRKAIDRYLADPAGYAIDENDWNDLYENRSRDFSTCFALGKPDASAIGFSGKREPRFFSQAVKEADIHSPVTIKPTDFEIKLPQNYAPELSVRVADLASVQKAAENGANRIYIGGEAFLPHKPWSLKDIKAAMDIGGKYKVKIIVTTPRATMERECGELEQLFTQLNEIRPDGIMVSNMGTLNMATQLTTLPVQTDFSFNTFNHLSAKLLKDNGSTMGTISLEATYAQIKELLFSSKLPLELIVHGPTEAMILDHNLPHMILGYDINTQPELFNRHYGLLDSANEVHPIRIDQHERNHVLFAKDLCLIKFLAKLLGAASYRIEGQHYDAKLVGQLTKIYRQELDKMLNSPMQYEFDPNLLTQLSTISPRELGIGAFRYRVSR